MAAGSLLLLDVHSHQLGLPASPSPVRQHILTELNKQLAIAPALIGRQRQDAGHIVIFCGFLFLEEELVGFSEGWAKGRAEGQPG